MHFLTPASIGIIAAMGDSISVSELRTYNMQDSVEIYKCFNLLILSNNAFFIKLIHEVELIKSCF